MAEVILVALLTASLPPLAAHALDFVVHDESSLTRTLRFAGSGVHTLDVRAFSGAIQVSGYDGVDVQVEVHKRIAAESDDALRAAQRDVVIETMDGAATLEVVVRESDRPTCGDSAGERSRAWWDRRRYQVTTDFTIRVPRDTRLRLCTIQGPEVRVDGTAGDFDIQNVNGAVTLEAMRGSGRATTVNGRITAVFAETPRSASLFKTVNGSIVATLPRDASADLELKTFNGGLFTDFDVLTRAAQPETAPDRRNGRFVYRSRGFTAVRVGSGGPTLTMDTFNGDVRVLRAR